MSPPTSSSKPLPEPTRLRSVRIQNLRDNPRKVQPPVSYDKSWSGREKETLLRALREHGSANVRAVAGKIPTRTPEQVKTYLVNMKKSQRFAIERSAKGLETLVQRNPDSAIETWIGVANGTLPVPEFVVPTQPGVADAVPATFKMISRFEAHPPMATAESVDYAAIYGSLAELMQGEVPRDLNLATSLKILEMVKRFCAEINDPKMKSSLLEKKKKLEEHSITLSLYQRKDHLHWESQHLLNEVNVFHFPEDMFVNKKN